jgi:hypothetical protein
MTTETTPYTLEELHKQRREWLLKANEANIFSDLAIIGTTLGKEYMPDHAGILRFSFTANNNANNITLYVNNESGDFNPTTQQFNYTVTIAVWYGDLLVVDVELYSQNPKYIADNPRNLYVPGQWEEQILAFSTKAKDIISKAVIEKAEAERVSLQERLLIGKQV